MTSKKFMFLGGLLAGALIFPGAPASADSNEVHNRWNHGYREKWQDDHDRRYDHLSKRDARHDKRSHFNRSKGRKRFSDIRGARKEVQQDRKELRSDYQGLRKDRAELRRDVRNGASQKEIFQDRQEIHRDLKEIAKDKRELQQDQGKLQTTRRELKEDWRKK